MTEYFGQLGGSWKKEAKKSSDSVLHGENGQGRYKAFALGGVITWVTRYLSNNKVVEYSIKGDINNIEQVISTDPKIITNKQTGTSVYIENLDSKVTLQQESTINNLAKLFYIYLSKYPTKKLIFNQEEITPIMAQKSRKEIDLGDVNLRTGNTFNLKLAIVEWNGKSDRMIYFCDGKGCFLEELEFKNKIKSNKNDFSVYVMSDSFIELKKSQMLTNEMDEEVNEIIDIVISNTKNYFSEKALKEKSKIIEEWVDEGIYPYNREDESNLVRKAEKQVFDILAVNVSSYLHKFDGQNKKSKKFTFQLLKQAIENNPESVQKIISEVLELKKEEQDELAYLLEKTTLSSIIKSAKIVASRLDFIQGLENLLFDQGTKKSLLERDQLHKILEKEAWLFSEDFYLAGSEVRLEEVLEKHINILGDRTDDSIDQKHPVLLPNGKQGRIDLMFAKARKPTEDSIEYLVIELKRPSKTIDTVVLSQIEQYALAVCADERFLQNKAKWTFIAVSNQMDKHAKRKARQRDRLEGLTYVDSEFNVEVWIMTWPEIIHKARVKLNFFANQLNYDATRNSATEYLERIHKQFIPKSE